MKLAIISDSHDNIPNIEKFALWAERNSVKALIHCGDLASGEVLELLVKKFTGDIYLVYGNMDANYRDEIYITADNLPSVRVFGDTGELNIEGIKIAFCHFPEEAKKLASTGKYNLVFYGHTHKPWMETLSNNCQLINPGTLGGVFNKATFAVYDTVTGKLDLKVLELI